MKTAVNYKLRVSRMTYSDIKPLLKFVFFSIELFGGTLVFYWYSIGILLSTGDSKRLRE